MIKINISFRNKEVINDILVGRIKEKKVKSGSILREWNSKRVEAVSRVWSF